MLSKITELENSFISKRLSKSKNWRIKKFTRVDGKTFCRCYFRNYLGIWVVYKEWNKKPKEFSEDSVAKHFVKNERELNKSKYEKINAKKISKVEILRSKQEKRNENINKIV